MVSTRIQCSVCIVGFRVAAAETPYRPGLVLHAEVNGQGVLYTYNLVALLAGAPFRRLVQYADGLFGKRPVGRLQHLDIGQTVFHISGISREFQAVWI